MHQNNYMKSNLFTPTMQTENSLKILSEMAWNYSVRKNPSVPDEARHRYKYSDRDANSLTRCIVDFINFSGGTATRINSQGQYDALLKRWRKGMTRKGTPDVIGVLNGKSLNVEVKVGKDKMSLEQWQVKTDIENAGGYYHVAKNFQDFYEWINKIK